jgi:hypothetical protein
MRLRRGFAFIECIATLVAVGVLIALLLVMARRDRALAWQAGALSNLREFGAITGMYSADFQDQFWTFSWRANEVTPSEYADLRGPFASGLEAASAQATDILRRRAGRTDIQRPFGWIPHVTFGPLVLADYLGVEAPLRIAVSPGDRNLVAWSNDPAGYERGEYLPVTLPQWGPSKTSPYQSSFQYPAAFYSPDWATDTVSTVQPSSQENHYSVDADVQLGGRRVSDVLLPAHKVQMFDRAQWRAGTYDVSYIYAHARIATLLADASAAARPVAQANPGWDPGNVSYPFPLSLSYRADPLKPPVITPSGLDPYGTQVFQCRYAWTRGGLQGRDFDGSLWQAP